MLERSDEITKQLNRLANDRNITTHARNKIRDAAQHIKDLHAAVRNIRDLYFKLEKCKRDQVNQNRDNNKDDRGIEIVDG